MEKMSMQSHFKSLGLDQLSVAQRILLVQELWDSIALENGEIEMPQWHKDELDRRIDALESGTFSGSPWEDVKARLERKYEVEE